MTQPETTLLQQFGIGSSRWHWFGRGFLVGLMIIGAANAISYFVLSDGFSNLIGKKADEQELIGFPFQVWQRGKTYGTALINFPSFYINGATGVGLGLVIGTLWALLTNKLNQVAENILRVEQTSALPSETKSQDDSSGNQFSLGGLMIGTTLVALIVGLATKLQPDPRVIAGIFFFGPVVIIGITMLPRRWSLQFRMAALTVLAASSIGVAVAVGSGLELPFDEVLMGIFICWTPQGVIGTFLLVSWLAWKARGSA